MVWYYHYYYIIQNILYLYTSGQVKSVFMQPIVANLPQGAFPQRYRSWLFYGADCIPIRNTDFIYLTFLLFDYGHVAFSSLVLGHHCGHVMP